MSRLVHIATVQPPAPDTQLSSEQIQASALELAREAAAKGADIVCLPEFLNLIAVPPKEIKQAVVAGAHQLLKNATEIAREFKTWLICPVVIEINRKRCNRACLIDRQGEIIGSFDKVHCTQTEQTDLGIIPGNSWPVFSCEFGKIGIMICYDGCFPESSRILALNGAEIIFWPSLQRSFTETELVLQTRAHAYFNQIYVVRSSFGTGHGQVWSPGKIVGYSCICAPDGTILATQGRRVGWVGTAIDLDAPEKGYRSFGGEIGNLKEMRLADRRPEMYLPLVKI